MSIAFSRARKPVLALAGASLALALPSAAQAQQNHWLETRSKDGPMRPLVLTKLDRNTRYVATVSGTFSIYTKWKVGCGATSSAPMFKSPGILNGPVGADPEFFFADIASACETRQPALGRYVGFQIATGSAFADPVVLGAEPTAMRTDHTYRYALVGAGRKVRFRVVDPEAGDNYGRLKINLRRARPTDCRRAGWLSLSFATEAGCVKKLRAAARS